MRRGTVIILLTLLLPLTATALYAEALKKVGAATCQGCHSEQVEAFKKNVHAKALPELKNIPFEETCETCHGPGSAHAEAAGDRSNPGYATIRNPGKLKSSEAAETCLQCHKGEKQMFWKGSPHNARNLSCLNCHSVHKSKSDQYLLKAKSESETCFQCHREIRSQVARSAHMPVQEGKLVCGQCHNPHGSGSPKMINADSVNNLCYTCHTDKRGPFVWEHMPVRENCLNCHQPHGSHHERLLVAKRPLLCQRCHNITRHPSTLYDQADIQRGHNRIFVSSCQNCHSQIHGSNHPSGRFLAR